MKTVFEGSLLAFYPQGKINRNFTGFGTYRVRNLSEFESTGFETYRIRNLPNSEPFLCKKRYTLWISMKGVPSPFASPLRNYKR